MKINFFLILIVLISSSCKRTSSSLDKNFKKEVLTFLKADSCFLNKRGSDYFQLNINESHLELAVIKDKELVDVVAARLYGVLSRTHNSLQFDADFVIVITNYKGESSELKYRLSELSLLNSGIKSIETCINMLKNNNIPDQNLMFSNLDCIGIKEPIIETELNWKDIQLFWVTRIENTDVNICEKKLEVKLYKILFDVNDTILWFYFDPQSKRLVAIVDPLTFEGNVSA